MIDQTWEQLAKYDFLKYDRLESLQVVDEDIWKPEMVDQLDVDRHHVIRLLKLLQNIC